VDPLLFVNVQLKYNYFQFFFKSVLLFSIKNGLENVLPVNLFENGKKPNKDLYVPHFTKNAYLTLNICFKCLKNEGHVTLLLTLC